MMPGAAVGHRRGQWDVGFRWGSGVATGGSSLIAGAAVVFVGVLVLLMYTGFPVGMTYDEPIYQGKAVDALQWLKLFVISPSLAASPAAVVRYWHAKDQHPGFFKLVTAVCAVTLGHLAPPGEAFRTGTNFLAAVCCAVLYVFVAELWGRVAGLYAVGGLMLMPRVFGDCHLAALDAPIMALSLVTLVASWWACAAERDESRLRQWGRAALAGALWGLALGTKLNAFFIPLAVFPWALLTCLRRRGGDAAPTWGAVGRLALAYAVLGPLLFVATWPWLWHDTWARFLEYFRFHAKHWEIGVLYFGRVYTLAPWHYPLVMTALTTPPATLVLALAGLWQVAAQLRRRVADGLAARRRAALGLIVWALVVNLVPSCLPSTPKYNGVRLFLPIFPLLAILAAVGLRWSLDWVLRRCTPSAAGPGWYRSVALLGLFIALVGPLWAVAKFTPFYLSYYNVFIGGLPGAARAGLEPTYWGDTYRAAAWWLAKHAPPGATVWIDPPGFESTVRLFELGPLRPDLRFSAGPEGIAASDFAVTQNKPTEFLEVTRRLVATAQPVYTEGVDGVPLVYVFRLR